ncbi:hypothetical protein [Actinophytocola sp.]|uniref:hypothetical protein n=1 Tax=Actinophytocola sp. TaxID=1872138 RepID=UPI002D7F5E8D|nr:hypothetical protein [Actinophytocola sp.]HET9142006.1 hypothetical protein [Actinophytocola sp.]HEU5107128.1 hypothetical protein [Micromonosporaceae bacterium]
MGGTTPSNSISSWRRGIIAGIILLFALSPVAACGGSPDESGAPEPGVAYKPVLLPVKFSVTPQGVSITGDTSIVTPIGEFSINARYTLPNRPPGSIFVIIRDHLRGRHGTDDIYQVRAGGDNFTAVVNGRTVIEIRDGHVTIDVTDSVIESIQFRRVEPVAGRAEQGALGAWWSGAVRKWNAGWKSSFYKPFAMTRWAYDDSTIGEWYGLGFFWFMLRFTLTVLVAVVDVVLTAAFLLAQFAYLFWGPTGRNIVWALVALPFFWLLIMGGLAVLRDRYA